MRGLPDITGRALYFHAHYVAPGWRHLQPTTRIDGHIFYGERQR
jgi:spore germination cell wall hydrolase CwlJ-like protein